MAKIKVAKATINAGRKAYQKLQSLIDPKEVIVIHQAEEGVAKHVFSDPETIKNIESGGHIYSTTKITSWVSN